MGRSWSLFFLFALVALAAGATSRAADVPASAKPPFWAEHGFYLYRVSTPDAADVLARAEEGLVLTANLLDGSVPQIPMFNGLLGHDHPGAWNWDGAWPYWNRVTFRAGGDWKSLAGFMTRIRERANARATFHVNLTDVNIGLRDHPETREFFRKLVRTQSIYRRDEDPQTHRRKDPPYVPQEIDPYIAPRDRDRPNPVQIFALVNYKNFWESGLAKSMLDEFYGHLPYAPPVLYLDVFNLAGGNFSTGFPDGPLGGSEQTQLQGALAIIDYLRSKGSDLGTEGDRPYGKRADGTPRAGYVWYHGAGFSADNYGVISGGSGINLPGHHVFGNPGAFNLSPVASTAPGLQTVRAHYAALLAGQPGLRKVAGPETWHLPDRSGAPATDAFSIPGTGDAFRGDWVDLVNYFYLAVIQENYHLGKRNVRQRFHSLGRVHLRNYELLSADGQRTSVSFPDFLTDWRKAGAQRAGQIMLEFPIETKVRIAKAGSYKLTVFYQSPGQDPHRNFNVYVNGRLHRNVTPLAPLKNYQEWTAADTGEVQLPEGENTVAVDAGSVRATWSDGTIAEWTTPYLRKGFRAGNGDVVFAVDYDRMWPDTWSGQKKIYFFSWVGTARAWKLPAEWSQHRVVTLHPLAPSGRGPGTKLAVTNRSVSPKLLPQVPYILVPAASRTDPF